MTIIFRQKTYYALWLDKFYCAVEVQREFRRTYKDNPPDDECARRRYNKFRESASVEKR
jgi:hypothetical protein